MGNRDDAGRRRPHHHRDDDRDWNLRGDASSHGGRRRRVHREDSRISRGTRSAVDSGREPPPTMPPSSAYLASTRPYRRPSDTAIYEDENTLRREKPGRRSSEGHAPASDDRPRLRRTLSPVHDERRHRTASPGSVSSMPSSLSEDEGTTDDERKSLGSEASDSQEVEEAEADDEASITRGRKKTSDPGTASSDEDIKFRRRRRSAPSSSNTRDMSRQTSRSDFESPRRRPKRIEPPPRRSMMLEPPPRCPQAPGAFPSRSTSRSRMTSRSTVTSPSRVSSIIIDSRPPVSSKRPARRSEPVLHHETTPRRIKKAPSSRSSARSSSHLRSSLLGSIVSSAASHQIPHDKKKGKEKVREKHKEKEKPAKMEKCDICLAEKAVHKTPKLNCGHRMCHTCMKRNFELSVKDPQHMPPKCCNESIPLKHVERIFDPSFKSLWNRKFAEFTTKDRLYCPSKRCGEWIKPSQIKRDGNRSSARCGECKTKVCVNCNGKWHSSFDCPKDEETQKFLKQAKDEGWQRCYSCKAMVEKGQGCNHMTCRCGAQFCMLCGVEWRGCDCEWFNDLGEVDYYNDRLIADMFNNEANWDDDGDEDVARPAARREHTVHRRTAEGERPRFGGYEEESRHRRIQEQHDEDLARRMQYEMSMHDSEEEHYDVGLGINSGHRRNEHYQQQERLRRGSRRHRTMPPPAPQPPTATGNPFEREPAPQSPAASAFERESAPIPIRRSFDREPIPQPPAGRTFERERTYPQTARYDRGSYVTDINRARGSRRHSRSRSLDRRLANRFSENRQPEPRQHTIDRRPSHQSFVPPPHGILAHGPPHMSPPRHMVSRMSPPHHLGPRVSPPHHLSPRMLQGPILPLGGAPPPHSMAGPHYAPMSMPIRMAPGRGPPMMIQPPPHFGSPPDPYAPTYAPRPTDRHSYMVPGYDDDVRRPHAMDDRHRRASDSVPRSSTLAGLDGPPGGGVNRVFGWRDFVEPGFDDGDSVQS